MVILYVSLKYWVSISHPFPLPVETGCEKDRIRCSHGAVKVWDSFGKKLDPNFLGREFVRFQWFRGNASRNRANIRPVPDSSGPGSTGP